jgi:hypothetical protein
MSVAKINTILGKLYKDEPAQLDELEHLLSKVQSGGSSSQYAKINDMLTEMTGKSHNLTSDQIIDLSQSGGARKRKSAKKTTKKTTKRTTKKSKSKSKGKKVKKTKSKGKKVKKTKSKSKTKSKGKGRGKKTQKGGAKKSRSKAKKTKSKAKKTKSKAKKTKSKAKKTKTKSKSKTRKTSRKTVKKTKSKSRSKSKTRGRKMKRDEGKPKRKMNNYMIASNDIKKWIKGQVGDARGKENVGATTSAVSQMIKKHHAEKVVDPVKAVSDVKKAFSKSEFMKLYNAAVKRITEKRAEKKRGKM